MGYWPKESFDRRQFPTFVDNWRGASSHLAPVSDGNHSDVRSACGALILYLTKIEPDLEKIVLSHQAHPFDGYSAKNKD